MSQTKIDKFLEKISNDLLNDPAKSKWEGTDVSWWLAKLATEVNVISRTLNDNHEADIEKLTVNIASYVFIINYLQSKKSVKKKRRSRKVNKKT